MKRTVINISILLFFILNLTVYAFSISKFISTNTIEDDIGFKDGVVSIEYLIDNNEVSYSKSVDGLIDITFANQTINLGSGFSALVFSDFDEVFENGRPIDDKCKISKITISTNIEMGSTLQERIINWDYCLENV